MPTSSKSPTAAGSDVTVSFEDSIALGRKQVRWTPKGVSLLTKWYFEQGAEVEFRFEHGGEKHRCLGIVVACHPLRTPRGHYSTVLYFVETPCPKLHQAACACQLAEEEKQSRSPRMLD